MACINSSFLATQPDASEAKDGEYYLPTLSPRFFPSFEALEAALKQVANDGGYCLSIGASRKDDAGVERHAEFRCSVYEESRNNHQLAEEDRQRKRSSEKYYCKFKIEATRQKDIWTFGYVVGFHNHEALKSEDSETSSRKKSGRLSHDGAPLSINSIYFPQRPPIPSSEILAAGIEAALSIQRRALTHGKRPFAAVLVAPDNTTILLTHQSLDHVNHAESSLARLAATHFDQPYLWTCTLYSTWEPCAMCTSTCYWAHIGRIVYAASETRLKEITGEGNEENFTMSMPCRDVLKGSQKDIEVIGPVAGWEDIVVKESDEGYWRRVREENQRQAVAGLCD